MTRERTNTRPLGMVLVQQGVITAEELEAALVEQEEVGGLLGEVLIRRRLVSRPDITAALAQQFGLDLEAPSKLGGGLRSRIQRNHDARREREGPPAAADEQEDGEQPGPSLDARPVDTPTAHAGALADADAADPDETTESQPGDDERMELLFTLVAERDATIADLSRDLELAAERGAGIEEERARNTDLAAALEALERGIGPEGEAAFSSLGDEPAAERDGGGDSEAPTISPPAQARTETAAAGVKLDAVPLLSRSTDDRDAKARLEEERRQRDLNPARRFEYHVLRVGLKVRAEAQINELGARGWQLVQVVETDGHLAFYFERELAPASREAEAEAAGAAIDAGETTDA